MPTYTAGVLTTAGSTTLPIAALVGTAAVRPKIREIGVFNTTGTAVAVKLCRLSTAGTPGTAATVDKSSDPEGSAAVASLRNTYTSTAPTITDAGYRAQLGAASGSGVVWTFPSGLAIPAIAAAGVGVVVESGTGQACEVYFSWEE